MLRENPRPVLQVGTSPRMPLREHLKNFYFLFFGSNFNRCIVVASLMLLLISFVSTASVSTLWYHVMEGILTFLFAGEIALRLAVMRSNFWESAYNISEVVACVLCITIFFILHFFASAVFTGGAPSAYHFALSWPVTADDRCCCCRHHGFDKWRGWHSAFFCK
ncbi:hypothetical protein C4B63_513g3 [Trypanosoma cruzi]|uniref:Ion transport domain-containing protein n=1 Tax=Trypanosoma cruzi TaxID=5693 RepID=A0A2V2UFU6_TRYCR|nr:hypothetical protein C4B63_513g3 [Trypanosoma cruzi]